jgi:hypothetical protein
MKAALVGAAAAAALLATPVGLLEMIVASSGFSEALPAAAPPLGLTARLLMAGFAALLAIGLLAMLRRDPPVADDEWEEDGRGGRVQGANKMGFAFSKLTALARGRAMPVAEPDAPTLRRADAHPDAPPRPPIFASRDFDGVEIFARPETSRRPLVIRPESGPRSASPSSTFAMPRAPMPLAEEQLSEPAFLRPAAPFSRSGEETENAATAIVGPSAADASLPDDCDAPVEAGPVLRSAPKSPFQQESGPRPAPRPLPTHGLSIAQLTERLEQGLASRRRAAAGDVTQVLADMPVAPAVPVRDCVAPDADEALRAALGALRNIAARPR